MRRAWDEFWLARGKTTALDLFRILFAAALMAEVHTSQVKNLNAIDDGLFHLPYLQAIPTMAEPTYHLLHALQPPLLLLLALGLFPRLSCATLFAVQGWLFFADRLNFRNHAYLFLLLLLLLALAPVGRSLSLPALLRALGGRPHAFFGDRRPLTVQRLIQVQLCIAYFFAGLHKLHPAFLQGDVLRHLLHERWPRIADGPPTALAAIACAAAVFELWLPFALWHRRTRPVAVALGIVFHLSVALALDITVFSSVMIASYVLFLDPERPSAWLRDRAARLWGEPSPGGAS